MPKLVRRRYLALRVVSEQHVNERAVIDAVWNAVLELFGEYGASQTNVSLIEYDPRRNFVVVRCSHTALERVRASVASVIKIDGKPAVIHVMGVSGTLRTLHKKVST